MFISDADPISSVLESCVEKEAVLEVLQCSSLDHLSQISIRGQQGYTQNGSSFFTTWQKTVTKKTKCFRYTFYFKISLKCILQVTITKLLTERKNTQERFGIVICTLASSPSKGRGYLWKKGIFYTTTTLVANHNAVLIPCFIWYLWETKLQCYNILQWNTSPKCYHLTTFFRETLLNLKFGVFSQF